MGKLRIEPKNKALVEGDKYQELLQNLVDARNASDDHELFWDLDKGEDAAKVRKEFLFVAERENINVKIRRLRNVNSLALKFGDAPEEQTRSRIPADVARQRILTALVTAGRPMSKSEIVSVTNISGASWNLRIKELIESGEVQKEGSRRDTVYSLI